MGLFVEIVIIRYIDSFSFTIIARICVCHPYIMISLHSNTKKMKCWRLDLYATPYLYATTEFIDISNFKEHVFLFGRYAANLQNHTIKRTNHYIYGMMCSNNFCGRRASYNK